MAFETCKFSSNYVHTKEKNLQRKFHVNFAILERQYFAGFYFRGFNRQIWKKGIEFRDSSFLNFILSFKKSELLKFLDKLEQAKRIFKN